MIDIIPNWHPVFVHYTIALLSVSVVIYLFSNFAAQYTTRLQLRVMARWSLWIGSALSVLTVAAGVYAYYTVNHDGPSHEWMTIHRNVALGTFLVFGIAAVWAIWCHRSKNDEPRAFNGLLVIGLVALLSTSWLGGELVYRYGLGVMSLPKSEGDGHDHDHGEGHAHNVQPSSSDLSHQDDLMGGDAVMSGEEMPTHEHTDNKPHAH